MFNTESLVMLLPAVLASICYSQHGNQILRIMAIGVVYDLLFKSSTIMFLCSIGAMQALVESISTIKHFDFFVGFDIVQQILGIIGICAYVFNKNQKIQQIHLYFTSKILQLSSFVASTSFITIFLFQSDCAVFVSFSIASGFIIFERVLVNAKEIFDKELYQGIGVEANAVQNLSIFDRYKKNYSVSLGIVLSTLSILMPCLINYYGQFSYGLSSYLVIIGFSCCSFVFVIFLLFQFKNQKQVRKMCVKNNDYLPMQDGGEEPSFKTQLKNYFLFSQREIFWLFALLLVYEGVNFVYYGRSQLLYYFISSAVFSFFSMRQLINQCFMYQMIFQVAALLTFNQPIILFIHYMLQFLLNLQDKQPYSVPLLFASQFLLLSLSDFENAVIFTSVTLVLQIPQFIKKIQGSKLGCKLIVFANAFIFDTLISLSRPGYKNFVALGFVLVALLLYSKLFMVTAVDKSYANSTCFSIILRLCISLLDELILSQNIVYENFEVLLNLVKWNGYFGTSLSLLVQIISMFDLQMKISNWKYMILIPIFTVIIPLVALSPLCTTVSVFVLFASGFDLSNFGYVQQLCLQINAAYYDQPNWSWQVYTLQVLCRLFTGSLVGSLTVYILNYSYSDNFKLKINVFLSVAIASFLGLFLGVPLLSSALGEGTIEFSECIFLAIMFLVISTVSFMNPGDLAFQIVSYVLYGGLMIWSFFKQNISLGFVQLVFLATIQSLPQNGFIISFVISVMLLVTFVNVRYTMLIIKYSDAVSTVCLITAIFVLRYIMVKSTSIKRMLMRCKVEHQGVKFQNQLLEDIFEDKQERLSPLDVYKSLKLQMHLAVLILQAVFCSWNFGAMTAIFISLLVLLIPVDIRDEDGNIIQVGGYYGILDGWQINAENLLQMRQNYFMSLFISFNIYIINNFVQFLVLLGDDFYKQGLHKFILDIALWGILLVPSILGLISATGYCSKIFNKLVNLQRMKLFMIMSVLSVFAMIFATQIAIKMLAIFILIGGVFQAPSTVGVTKGKRVVHV